MKAIELIKDPIMIIAGAGSGKTRVLTYKIAYLIEKGFNPSSILALTFTNKSASEMKDRIVGLIGKYKVEKISIGTFHYIFGKILRIESKILGYKSNYTICSKKDTENLIKKIIIELNLNKENYKYKNIIKFISFYKNNLISLLKYHSSIISIEEQEYITIMPKIRDIYNIYINRCLKLNIMDLDDLIFKTSELFIKYSYIKNKYQKKYQYILVDEYQDINYAQYFIIKTLSLYYKNICVVGDDSQSIYAFRGANINNILNFKNDFFNAKIIKLEQNYRSTYHILEAANNIISNNINQIRKNIWTKNNIGEKITVFKAKSDIDESIFIIKKIIKIKEKFNKKNKDFAILYRNNIQSKSIENQLLQKNIPYHIYGNISFYNIAIIKKIISYLRYLVNINDEESLLQIINYPKRGIGKTTIKKILEISILHKVSLYQVLNNINNYKNEISINRSVISNIQKFTTIINYIISNITIYNAYIITKKVIKLFGIENNILKKNNDNQYIVEFLKNIKFYIKEQNKINNINLSLSNFIEKISINDLDKNNDIKDKISLMTIHSSKGLEYSVIFIIGVEENIIPSILCKNILEKIEEERRLFYVALTRAKDKVFISYVYKRNINNILTNTKPSRFIKEINHNHIINYDYKYSLYNLNNYNNKNFISNNKTLLNSKKYSNSNIEIDNKILLLKKGSNILHEKFGKGKVLFIEGHGINKIAIIKFNNLGSKKIFLKFSKFRII